MVKGGLLREWNSPTEYHPAQCNLPCADRNFIHQLDIVENGQQYDVEVGEDILNYDDDDNEEEEEELGKNHKP